MSASGGIPSGKRCLAVDYGDKRTGLAVSDPSGIIVQPLPVVESEDLETLVEAIVAEADRQEAGTIVVGLPLRLDGGEGSRVLKTRRLVEQLRKRLSVPVVEWDERLTSAEAEELLREAGLDWRKRKGKIDKVAAVLILRSYLSAQR